MNLPFLYKREVTDWWHHNDPSNGIRYTFRAGQKVVFKDSVKTYIRKSEDYFELKDKVDNVFAVKGLTTNFLDEDLVLLREVRGELRPTILRPAGVYDGGN